MRTFLQCSRTIDDVLLAARTVAGAWRGGGDSIKAECRLSETALALLLLALAIGVVVDVSAT